MPFACSDMVVPSSDECFTAISRYVGQALNTYSSPSSRRLQFLARRANQREAAHAVLAAADAVARDEALQHRSATLAASSAAAAVRILQASGKCTRCALIRKHCICQRLDDLRAEAVAAEDVHHRCPRVRFAVWMHAREWKRASNTGKLLLQVLPGCDAFMHDVPGELERLQRAASAATMGNNCHVIDSMCADGSSVNAAAFGAEADRAFVLFPSEDAIQADQLLSRIAPATSDAAARGTDGRQEANVAPSKEFFVVLVDGTWNQARRMQKHLHCFPRVALVPRAPSQFAGRKQSTEGRISTVEAAALLLEDLRAAPGLADALRRALVALNVALQSQDGYVRGAAPVASRARSRVDGDDSDDGSPDDA